MFMNEQSLKESYEASVHKEVHKIFTYSSTAGENRLLVGVYRKYG